MIRKILLFFIALWGLAAAGGKASAQSISDVAFDFRDDKVYVTYQAAIPDLHYLTNVSLLVSYDDGPFRPVTEHVSGDLGRIETGGLKTIVWDCFASNGYQPITGRIQFRIDYDYMFNQRAYQLHKPVFYFEYVWSSVARYGVGLGYGKRLGGYLRVGAERVSLEHVTITNNDDLTLLVTGGVFLRATNWLRFNAGIGYGQIVDEHEYYLHKSLAYEAGLTISIFRQKWLGFTVGYHGLVAAPARLGGIQAGISINL